MDFTRYMGDILAYLRLFSLNKALRRLEMNDDFCIDVEIIDVANKHFIAREIYFY